MTVKQCMVNLLAIVVLSTMSPALQADDEANKVFRKVSPGVVYIETGEGFGSGVVVKSSGLILTNLHVIQGHDTVTVHAVVLRGTREREETLVGTVTGAHGSYDAALVEVDLPAGGKLIRVPSIKEKVLTGATCYAIGNPGVGATALRNSISKGIVSSARQDVSGLEYIQTTAPINPGNSGGALVDKSGRLLGIVSFKVAETEGLGFAVPVREVKPSQFHKKHLERKLSNSGTLGISDLPISAISCFIIGGLLWLVAYVWFIITAFRAGLGWGLSVLVLGLWFPIIKLVFLILAWDEAKKPFCVALLSIGSFIAGFVFLAS